MQVRASNKRIAAAFSGHPAAAELLQVCGWHTQVVDYEKCWTFDAQPGSVTFGCDSFYSVCCFLQDMLEQTLDGLQTAVRRTGCWSTLWPSFRRLWRSCRPSSGCAARALLASPAAVLAFQGCNALADMALACLVRVECACRLAATTVM